MIEIRGLAKSYGDHQALHDVSLSIRPGEFVVVLGPSGAGKSTLLRCINRLIEPTAGDMSRCCWARWWRGWMPG